MLLESIERASLAGVVDEDLELVTACENSRANAVDSLEASVALAGATCPIIELVESTALTGLFIQLETWVTLLAQIAKVASVAVDQDQRTHDTLVSLLETIGIALGTHIVDEYGSLVAVGDDPAPADSIDPLVAINAVTHTPP